jgi:hypothetical protein
LAFQIGEFPVEFLIDVDGWIIGFDEQRVFVEIGEGVDEMSAEFCINLIDSKLPRFCRKNNYMKS